MRMSAYVITAVLAAGLPSTAIAQTAPPASIPATVPAPIAGPTLSHWTAAGFVGSNFGGNTAVDASTSFGGQVGYLWRGVVGGEFIADFAPSFNLNNVFLSENPRTNAYMGNVIFAMPIGGSGQWQPYVSGGAGSISLRTVVINALVPTENGILVGTTTNDQFKFGWDVGGGLMGFHGLIGFRADARFYKASNTSQFQTTPSGVLTDALLTGLDFWRADIGVALRW